MSAITQALQNVLQWIYGFIGDYGWSVVLFTLAFRFCLMPFDIISRRSMRKQALDMARIQPKLDELKAKYANDQEKLNRKTMEVYKKENVSMFGGCAGGCLPMLIQWPVFIAFFSALRVVSENQIFNIYQTIEATGAVEMPKWLWVQNLWQPDTFQASVLPSFAEVSNYASFAGVTEEAYNTAMAPLLTQFDGIVNGLYILPILAAGASFLQGWLGTYLQKTPEQRAREKAEKAKGKKNQDPNAQSGKMMQYMFPVMSFFFCMTSSAAFSLYWLTSSIAAICSTLLIDKVFLRNLGKEKKPTKSKEEVF